MKKQRKELNKFETSHQKKLYDQKQQKKDIPEQSDGELANSPLFGGSEKLSQTSTE